MRKCLLSMVFYGTAAFAALYLNQHVSASWLGTLVLLAGIIYIALAAEAVIALLMPKLFGPLHGKFWQLLGWIVRCAAGATIFLGGVYHIVITPLNLWSWMLAVVLLAAGVIVALLGYNELPGPPEMPHERRARKRALAH